MRLLFILMLVSINAFSQSKAGLRFIQNKGQWDERTDFQAPLPGGRLGVSAAGFNILLLDMDEIEKRHSQHTVPSLNRVLQIPANR